MTTGLDVSTHARNVLKFSTQLKSTVAQMTFLAHETLHMSSLDPTNGMLCLGRAQDPLGGR